MTDPAPDWDALFDEAVDTLCQFIRIDTSNPPGRERAACDFLGAILKREGIPYQLFDAGDDRVSLRAVLPGDGSRRPFMLLNHTDVVPVQREYWDDEPFSGHIRDGYIWGRGALDMKGLGVAQLMTFLTLKRLGVPLHRDLVFFAMADEEAGSEFGMRWIERNHPESLEAEYVINEGGGGTTEVFGVERPVFNVAVTEKGPLWLRLVAEGRPGHGSMPHDDNALDRLVRALHKVQSWERPFTVSPVLGEYFTRLARAGIYKGEATVAALTKAAEDDIRVRALLMDTISATTATAGIKHNVIPGRAEATLDCRLLPGVDPDEFQRAVEGVIDDPKVRVERVHVGWSDTNPFDTELFRVIEDVVHDHIEEAVVVPGMTVGFTDSSVLRNRGQLSYGFSGGLTTPEVAKGVHGHNERVSLESFRLNCQMVYEVTRRMCAEG
ncbi:MAG: M20/M25/M40 family metallo-hydrolase [Chloroflexi bacterium]|nr:M20/M25/M40 family metallo-hydrolase [Chloroflexota bacterium]